MQDECSGVQPRLARADVDAPLLMSTDTADACPACAALCRAVHPFGVSHEKQTKRDEITRNGEKKQGTGGEQRKTSEWGGGGRRKQGQTSPRNNKETKRQDGKVCHWVGHRCVRQFRRIAYYAEEHDSYGKIPGGMHNTRVADMPHRSP